MPIRTLEQNKRLHTLVSALNLTKEQKEDLVFTHTSERSFSSADMQVTECQALINYLQALKNGHAPAPKFENDPANRQRRKMLAICHEIHWTVNGKVDLARLDEWLIKFGKFHKPLKELTLLELPQQISQFEKLQKSFYAKK